MLNSTIGKILAGALGCALAVGCKSPICRVGGGQGITEMKQWMNLAQPSIPGSRHWQRYEDYRGKRITIHAPDLQLLCGADCEKVKAQIAEAIGTHLIAGLQRQAGYDFVEDRKDADYEIHIKVAKVREHHPIEYVNLLPPRDYYNLWCKLTNVRTGRTAFWAAETDFFTEADHRRTYGRLLSAFNDFQREHD